MTDTTAEAIVKPDWESLAKTLNVGSPEEAEKRAYEIASFVVRIEKDKDSKLILKTGGKSLELTLNK
jgi:hypothetical protein